MAVFQPELSIFREQLKSIQDQNFDQWVCIIVSDSPLIELFKDPKIAEFQIDPRFKWFENPIRLGHKKNFEKSAQIALNEGVDAIGFSDQDDIWYPTKLSVSIQTLQRMGQLSVVHCDMHILNNKSMDLQNETVWRVEKRGVHHTQLIHLLVRNVIAGCGMLMDAELVRRYPNIPDQVEYHDHWFAIVGASQGGVYPISIPLYAYRQHLDNILGITPFKNFFAIPPRLRSIGIFRYCRDRWKRTHVLALAAQKAQLPLTKFEEILMISRLDLGLGLILLGLYNLASDRPFARACIARGLGKLLSVFDESI